MLIRLASHYRENAWVRMIKANWPNCLESSQIILVRYVISCPGNDVEWRVILSVFEEFSLEFVDNCPFFSRVFIPSCWSLELPWVCKSVCANWPQVWNDKMSLIYFTTPSFSLTFLIFRIKINLIFDSSLNYANFEGRHDHSTEFCSDKKSSLLRHYHEVAIRTVVCRSSHTPIEWIGVNAKAHFQARLSSSAHCFHSLNEVNRSLILCRVLNRLPSHLLGSNVKSLIAAICKIRN